MSKARRDFRADALVGIMVGVLAVACGGAGPESLRTFTPATTGFTTFAESAGTIDPDGPCTPPTPPARPAPASPGSSELLVGYQDWRNTHADVTGLQCQSSNARRFQGVATFDMKDVVAELNSNPISGVSGTLSFKLGSFLSIPPSAGSVLDLCIQDLELAASPPTQSGLVSLNFLIGQEFPASTKPSLGVLSFPTSVPFGSITTRGPVTVDPSPPAPSISVDVSVLLSDWAAKRDSSLAVVFQPRGRPLGSMGFRERPPTPVPVARAGTECTSILKNLALSVRVNRAPIIWRELAVGLGEHACALKTSGEVYCWGSDDFGQLGADAPVACEKTVYPPDGSSVQRQYKCSFAPVVVTCGNAPCSFISLSAGATHTCALDQNQRAWCWGNNYNGQLGLGASEPAVMGGQTPRQVLGNLQFAAISAGGFHTCGLTTAGRVYCWGNNLGAQTGSSASQEVSTPFEVPLSGRYTAVSAGWNHTCALDEGGILYCWGTNVQGILANTPNVTPNPVPWCGNCTATPLRVQGPAFPALEHALVDIVSTGANQTCAHTTLGETICWGSRTMRSGLDASRSASQLSAGFSGYCALVNNKALCWGDGNNGELGDGVFHDAVQGPFGPAPTVAPPDGFLRVDMGTAVACGIGRDQEIYCWGANHSGMIGDGTLEWRNVPTKVLFH